ncbi:phage protein NinX family protein [Burkholderia gladioli]|uniref:phage protein NinX family protein n=1 Tax=Burkholderia gladioli TaxID=28095 RepID=UPI003B985564
MIERERIAVYWDVDEWVALWHAEAGPAGTLHANGPTMVGPSALVAAMRCFVAAKFGDEVDHEDA